MSGMENSTAVTARGAKTPTMTVTDSGCGLVLQTEKAKWSVATGAGSVV